jgi:large subunit ribosomal protein L22
MMAYSFNLKREPFAFALCEEVNASYKDLGAVCDAIRYLKADSAMSLLDIVARKAAPIPYRRHNKYMGSRHELKGGKGAYPVKAAKEVKVALVNALANAENKGMDRDSVFVIHASATKTRTETRPPSKGSLSWGRGRYGASSAVRSNLEYARIEIGLGNGTEEELTSNMKHFIKEKNGIKEIKAVPKRERKAVAAPKKAQPEKKEAKEAGAAAAPAHSHEGHIHAEHSHAEQAKSE